jgi:hypothetical protein
MGRPKQQLVPHPHTRRFDAAPELCWLPREERLKGPDIVAILNADHDRYPPLGQGWTYNMVEGLIANPTNTALVACRGMRGENLTPGPSSPPGDTMF